MLLYQIFNQITRFKNVLFSYFGIVLPDILHSLCALRGDFKLIYIYMAYRRGDFWRNVRIFVHAGEKYFCSAGYLKANIVCDFDSFVCVVFRA
jgi:hypothetical protein